MTRTLGALLASCLISLALPAVAADEPVDEAVRRAYWQNRAREVHATRQTALRRYQAAVAAYESMRSRKRLRGAKKAAVIAERGKAKEALRQAEEALEALPEQARKADAPPGWIRLREPGPASRR